MSIAFYRRTRPRVEWSRNCPRCRGVGTVEVKTGGAYTRFWYCAARGCGWARWRPPAGLIWSHSRLSVGCHGCGLRLALPRLGEGEGCHRPGRITTH
jgi:hypothetical protein